LRLGDLRNQAARAGSAEIIVFVDDDIVFPETWGQRLRQFTDRFAWFVLANRILLPDGNRYWDRATIHPHCLVSYDHPVDNPQLYQCGCFMVIKRQVFERFQWDESIPIYAERSGGVNEDVEYSQRLIANGYQIVFDRENYVWHWDENYVQEGPYIHRRHRDPYPYCDEFKRLVNTLQNHAAE
jgi:GT2 family glycosyltransferase